MGPVEEAIIIPNQQMNRPVLTSNFPTGINNLQTTTNFSVERSSWHSGFGSYNGASIIKSIFF